MDWPTATTWTRTAATFARHGPIFGRHLICNTNLILLSLAGLCCFTQSIYTSDQNGTDQHWQAIVSTSNKSTNSVPETRYSRPITWPNKRLNVLIDKRSLNITEQATIRSYLAELNSKTCVQVGELDEKWRQTLWQTVMMTTNQTSGRNNYLHIFKTRSIGRPDALGLSSFGCAHQGRQSLVLTDLALARPELVLRYHLLRTLGVDRLERPQLSTTSSGGLLSNPIGSKENNVHHWAVSSGDATQAKQNNTVHLSDVDLERVKQLYNCTELQGRLSAGVVELLPNNNNNNSLGEHKDDDGAQADIEQQQATVNRIAETLLASDSNENKQTPATSKSATLGKQSKLLDGRESSVQEQCGASESDRANSSCPIRGAFDANGNELASFVSSKPMVLKLDEFHARDEQIGQANQMKVMQQRREKEKSSSTQEASYRLFGQAAEPDALSQLLGRQQQSMMGAGGLDSKRHEMLISFEQTPNAGQDGNAAAAMVNSQLLKLCSCTCQTMVPSSSTPAGGERPREPASTSAPQVQPQTQWPIFPPTASPPFQPPAWTYEPVPVPVPQPTYTVPPFTVWPPQLPPGSTNDWNDWPGSATSWNYSSTPFVAPSPTNSSPAQPQPNSNEFTWPPYTFSDMPTTTTTIPTKPPSSDNELPPTTVTSSSSSNYSTESTPDQTTTSDDNLAPFGANLCDQVEWAKPNKSLYSSARIVWDVDRGNQNYFLCQATLNGELLPGKTHGFSCKLSQEGRAYEAHSFNVLTKPENVNLAWVRRSSNSFGKQNLPVVGGKSKQQDPYIVARCLVKDENSDVITLIGYINNQGTGWFPFDDIQIECAQYDVLACVN